VTNSTASDASNTSELFEQFIPVSATALGSRGHHNNHEVSWQRSRHASTRASSTLTAGIFAQSEETLTRLLSSVIPVGNR